jgi:hypothetical protein
MNLAWYHSDTVLIIKILFTLQFEARDIPATCKPTNNEPTNNEPTNNEPSKKLTPSQLKN